MNVNLEKYLLLISVDFTFVRSDILCSIEFFLTDITLKLPFVGVRVHVINEARMLAEYFAAVLTRVLDEMAHSMRLVHFFSSTCVIACVTRKNRLDLVSFKVMFGHFTCSPFYRFLTNLALPLLARSTSNQHFVYKRKFGDINITISIGIVCVLLTYQSILSFTDVFLKFCFLSRSESPVYFLF